MKLLAALVLVSGVAVAGCQPEQAAEPPADAPAASESADVSGLALAQAAVSDVLAVVEADTENCTLPEGREREAQANDLGGGVGAVLADCSAGMRDVWRQLYLVREGGGEPERVPLVQYNIQGDGQWRAEFAQPELTWIAEDQTFHSATHDVRGCGVATTWRWDAAAGRIALVEQTEHDCDVAEGEDLPEPRVIWPTNPPTPEPQP